jgi:hypothetical protein
MLIWPSMYQSTIFVRQRPRAAERCTLPDAARDKLETVAS